MNQFFVDYNCINMDAPGWLITQLLAIAAAYKLVVKKVQSDPMADL